MDALGPAVAWAPRRAAIRDAPRAAGPHEFAASPAAGHRGAAARMDALGPRSHGRHSPRRGWAPEKGKAVSAWRPVGAVPPGSERGSGPRLARKNRGAPPGSRAQSAEPCRGPPGGGPGAQFPASSRAAPRSARRSARPLCSQGEFASVHHFLQRELDRQVEDGEPALQYYHLICDRNRVCCPRKKQQHLSRCIPRSGK